MTPKTTPAPAKAEAKAPALRDPRTFRVVNARPDSVRPNADGVLGPILWVPTDDAQLARLNAGEKIPLAEVAVRAYTEGDTVTGVPARDVADLLADGWLVPVEAAAPRATTEGDGA